MCRNELKVESVPEFQFYLHGGKSLVLKYCFVQYQEADSIEKVYGQLPRAEEQETR